ARDEDERATISIVSALTTLRFPGVAGRNQPGHSRRLAHATSRLLGGNLDLATQGKPLGRPRQLEATLVEARQVPTPIRTSSLAAGHLYMRIHSSLRRPRAVE